VDQESQRAAGLKRRPFDARKHRWLLNMCHGGQNRRNMLLTSYYLRHFDRFNAIMGLQWFMMFDAIMGDYQTVFD
jgi:hypothetical protein